MPEAAAVPCISLMEDLPYFQYWCIPVSQVQQEQTAPTLRTVVWPLMVRVWAMAGQLPRTEAVRAELPTTDPEEEEVVVG